MDNKAGFSSEKIPLASSSSTSTSEYHQSRQRESVPPPAYSTLDPNSSQQKEQERKLPYPPEKDPQAFKSGPSVPSSSLNPPPPASDTLHIYSSLHSGQITNAAKDQILYTFTRHQYAIGRDAHMTVSCGSPPVQIGTITFPFFHGPIEVTVHNRPILMEHNGIFSAGHTFSPLSDPSLGKLKWHSMGGLTIHNNPLVLENERKEELAVFENSGWSIDKWGRLEIMGGVFGVQGLADEVVVTCLAKLQFMKRNRQR